MVFHVADTYNDMFNFYADQDLRAISGFPQTHYTVYDEHRQIFVDLPTYSSIMVSASGMIIFKAASISRQDCPELGNLVKMLNRHAKWKRPLSMHLIDYRSESEIHSPGHGGTSSDADNYEVGSPTDERRSADWDAEMEHD